MISDLGLLGITSYILSTGLSGVGLPSLFRKGGRGGIRKMLFMYVSLHHVGTPTDVSGSPFWIHMTRCS